MCGHESGSSIAANFVSASFSTTRTKSSAFVPITLAITGTVTSFMFENSLTISSAPGFEYPTALSIPASNVTTVGFLWPSLGSRLTDFMVTAPAPLSATRFSKDLEVPRNPDGRMVGLDNLIPHKSVVRFGLVIFFWTQIIVDC